MEKHINKTRSLKYTNGFVCFFYPAGATLIFQRLLIPRCRMHKHLFAETLYPANNDHYFYALLSQLSIISQSNQQRSVLFPKAASQGKIR